MKTTFAVAGSVLVDKINEICAYPSIGELVKIQRVTPSVGGCVPNVAIDLKRLCPELCVKAVGLVGEDGEGAFVKQTLAGEGVDTSALLSVSEKTSFTEVMSVTGGQRTFFTFAGASALFGAEHVDFDVLQADYLHLGYFLLLDKIDAGDGVKILAEAKRRGVTTSIDLVSENSKRYSLVLPTLSFVDNLIINETEAGALTGIEPTENNLKEIAERLKGYGVLDRVIIHTPTMGVCLSERGFCAVPSLALPDGFIQGTTGAGDAFCAGALLAIAQKKSDEEILKIASVSAVGALSEADAVSGMKRIEELKEGCKTFERRKKCLLI